MARFVPFSVPGGGQVRRLFGVVAASLLLAACASSGGGGTSGLFGGGGASNQQVEIEEEFFLTPKFCPPVEIRVGTGTYRIYERGGDDDPSRLRFQASFSKTARECTRPIPTQMSIKLGLQGRIVAGPKGGAANLKLPIRVAVIKQSNNAVLFSQLYNMQMNITPPNFSVDVAQVIDQITFPITADDEDLIVFVGFDQGAG